MKLVHTLTLLPLFFSCSNQHPVATAKEAVPDPAFEYYLSDDVVYDRLQSVWLTKRDAASVAGLIVSHFQNGVISKVISVKAGKKDGPQVTYFPNGKIRFYEVFSAGKLHGTVKRWGMQYGYRLMAELHYYEGKLHGEQRKWYPTGELHKVLQMVMGGEEGLQQAYRKNGVLYANYEAKNGRTFGMKRSNLCYELKNEEIVYQQ